MTTKIDRAAVLSVGAALFAARPECAMRTGARADLADMAVDVVLALEAAIPRAEERIAESVRAERAKAHAEKVEAAERDAHEAAVDVAVRRAEKAAAAVAELRKAGKTKLRAVA